MKSSQHICYVILSLIFALSVTSCMNKDDKLQQQNIINVRTTQVQKKMLSLPINASGKLYTSSESKLSFKIPGIVSRIYVDEGKYVSKNTRLAQLDLVEMTAKVNQARSAYHKAKRDLSRKRPTTAPPRRSFSRKHCRSKRIRIC